MGGFSRPQSSCLCQVSFHPFDHQLEKASSPGVPPSLVSWEYDSISELSSTVNLAENTAGVDISLPQQSLQVCWTNTYSAILLQISWIW